MKKLLPLIFLSIILLSSCAKTAVREDGEKEKGVYPDAVLINATYTIAQDEGDPVFLKAGKLTLVSRDREAIVEDMFFQTFDSDGNVRIEGQCGKGVVKTDGSYMELYDGVIFSDRSGGMEIRADSLVYNKEEDTISAPGIVVVQSEEGSFTGSDFEGDLRYGKYSFGKIEKGELKGE